MSMLQNSWGGLCPRIQILAGGGGCPGGDIVLH